MSELDSLHVDLTVQLGTTRMPLHQLLKLGRGAIVELDGSDAEIVDILVNGHPIARGNVVVTGRAISIQVTEMIRKESVIRQGGVRIGGDGAPPFNLVTALERPAAA
ncbi:FliM/FliN family flagellar motor switch protein [Enterovirga sp. CN4-39]|uniref:FliM/FliN family flagellar motor switch protein n=1 Tax=Enterovirga sp. CN4-39 TaxID=3400910 RepID=UPI003C00DF3B